MTFDEYDLPYREPNPTFIPLRVAMIVANDVSVDTRVIKTATAVAELGHDVTILGTSSLGRQDEIFVAPAKLVRLAIDDTLRNRPGQRHKSLMLASDHDLRREIRHERATFQNYQLQVGSEIGWLRREYFEGRTKRARTVNEREVQKSSGDRKSQRQAEGIFELAARFLHKQAKRARSYRYEARERRLEARFRRADANLHRELVKAQVRSSARVGKLSAALANNTFILRKPHWRWALPQLHDFENAFGPELDRLDPDVLHVHDVHLLGVAVQRAGRAYVSGKITKVFYDAHEYIRGLGNYRQLTVDAYASLEKEFIHRADAVITVSEPIAELLYSQYQLKEKPHVILNAPVMSMSASVEIDPLRRVVGLGDEDLIVVYSGGLDRSRGVHTLVEAVGQMDSVHLVLVSNPSTAYARLLTEEAQDLGIRDRLHFAPLVPSDHVVDFLRSADLAVHPMLAGPVNHELALPNKLFDYIQARLPIVVSDCRAMSDLVQRLGVGKIFRSGDADSLMHALEAAFEDLGVIRERYLHISGELDEYTWDRQKQVLAGLYGNNGKAEPYGDA